jgi:hypothetical protein
MTGDRAIVDGSSEAWESPRGALVISHPVVGVMLYTYRGYMTVDVVPFIERTTARVLAVARRPPDVFIDLEEMTGYESAYRREVSKWGARTYRQFDEVRVLVRSKIVAMGIAVSNLTSAGKLKSTTKRSEFQSAIDQAIARHSS